MEKKLVIATYHNLPASVQQKYTKGDVKTVSIRSGINETITVTLRNGDKHKFVYRLSRGWVEERRG